MEVDEKKTNQIKNWLYQHLCLVRTCKDTVEGEPYNHIIPAPLPGECVDDHIARCDEKVTFAELELSIGRKAELEQISDICVKMIIKFLIEPANEKRIIVPPYIQRQRGN